MTDWERCKAFHGHECGGLTIGYKAALYAKELLDIKFSEDEQLVCIAENDACGLDAIQVLLGCTVGKGNLLFHITGKQAFSFYNRLNGKSVRLVLRPKPEGLTKEQSFEYFQSLEPSKMFDVKETTIPCPSAPSFSIPTSANAAAKRWAQTGFASRAAKSSASTASTNTTASMYEVTA